MKVFKYAKDIEWSLPLFLECEQIYAVIYDALKRRNRDITIKANLFGAPLTKWSAGRACPDISKKGGINLLRKALEYVRHYEAYPTFTFTNTMIDNDALHDNFSNAVLDVALSFNSRFIVTSDRLRDYIKSKRSNACVVASVILPAMKFQGRNQAKVKNIEEEESNFYNKLLKQYDSVVVRPEYSQSVLVEHPEYIDDISRVEVLINQTCIANCPKMPEHYRFYEKINSGKVSESENFYCIKQSIGEKSTYTYPLVHTDNIIYKLVKNGVRKLKIQGRCSSIHPLMLYSTITNYMFENTQETACLCQEAAFNLRDKLNL